MNKYLKSAFRQRGMATLVVSIVMLMSVTLIVLVSAQTVVTEQRIIANELRAKQAFEAASAGLSYGLGYFQANNGAAGTTNSSGDYYDLPGGYSSWTDVSGATGPSFRIRFNDDVETGDLKVLTIEAQGRSDDQSAVKSLSLIASGSPALALPPTNPLTARGFIDLQGSGTITNLESNTTIWCGDQVDFTAMAANTIIKHPSSGGGIEASNASNKGIDIVDNDTSLSTLSDTDYFQNFFGLSESNYQSSAAGIVIDPVETSVSTLDGEKATVIWVDGDASFTGNPVIGTADEPVVLIVDGNMFGAGNVTINGILFVTGNWTGTGSLDINGAAVVRGDVNGTGSLDVFYDSGLLGNLNTAGKGVGLPGTWTDFPSFVWN